MSDLEELKRQIVHQTVEENVALKEGQWFWRGSPSPQRPARQRLGRFVPFVLTAVLGAGLLGVFFQDQILEARQSIGFPGATAGAGENPDVRAAPGAPDLTEAPRKSRWATEPVPLVADASERIDPSIFPLRVRHVVLDPGHGGEDYGTRSGSLYEKNLTLDIAHHLKKLLVGADYQVSMTREDDRAVVLRERRDFANRIEADVFVSIHINWIATREIRGVETYFLGPAKDPELNDLARRENQNSGYSLADQGEIIRNVVLNAQHERSGQLAGRIQGALFRSLRPINPQLRNRGVKTAPFVVLVATEMPAILAEVSCLSNAEEAKLLSRPLYREHIAEALFKGIVGYAGDVNATQEAKEGP